MTIIVSVVSIKTAVVKSATKEMLQGVAVQSYSVYNNKKWVFHDDGTVSIYVDQKLKDTVPYKLKYNLINKTASVKIEGEYYEIVSVDGEITSIGGFLTVEP